MGVVLELFNEPRIYSYFDNIKLKSNLFSIYAMKNVK